MAKGPTFDILSRQANRRPICKDRGESELLCLSPVDTALWAKRCRTALQQAGQFSIGGKAFRPGQQFSVKSGQLFSRNGGRSLLLLLLPVPLVTIRLIICQVQTAIGFTPGLLKYCKGILRHLIGFFLCDNASLFRSSGKAKLIVDNDVNGTTNPVTREAPEVQGFGNNSFAWKSRIPMN